MTYPSGLAVRTCSPPRLETEPLAQLHSRIFDYLGLDVSNLDRHDLAVNLLLA